MRIKHFLSATALLLPLLLTAQKSVVPEVKVVNERNANPMVLQDLSVDILVVGQTAVTTMEMTFYNPNTRVMEGEFQFPLSDGQQVSRSSSCSIARVTVPRDTSSVIASERSDGRMDPVRSRPSATSAIM